MTVVKAKILRNLKLGEIQEVEVTINAVYVTIMEEEWLVVSNVLMEMYVNNVKLLNILILKVKVVFPVVLKKIQEEQPCGLILIRSAIDALNVVMQAVI